MLSESARRLPLYLPLDSGPQRIAIAAGVGVVALTALCFVAPSPLWQALLAVAGILLSVQLFELAKQGQRANRDHALAMEGMQRKLAEDRHAIDSLADGLDVAVFLVDAKASVLYANRRAQEMFRFADPEGRSILAITLSYDLETLVFEVVRDRQTFDAELTFSYPEERVNVASAWPEEGTHRIFLAIYEVTDLRRLERVRRDFVANVSHELRTPLATIRAMAETLLDDKGEDAALAERFLGKIVSEVDRLSLIANDLLVLSAAESNPVRKHWCDLGELVSSTVSQLGAKAKEKGLSLRYEGPESLPVEANAAQLAQVVINLVDNALNYTQDGSVMVRLAAQDQVAILEVSDTGLGISSQHLPRIFERFYRVDKGRSRMTGGTGLGLSIVKHLAEAHGGTVSVESSLNSGSTFRVELPVGDVTSTSPTEA